MTYQAPVKDMLFVLNHLAGLPRVAALPGFEEATPDTTQAVLEESARYAGDVLAPLNHPADREPSAWRDGAVTTSPGFKQAFRQYADAGWQGMTHPAEYGGQGLPGLIGSPCSEMLNAANLSFALCPLLTNGAIEALLTAGSPELKERFIGPMISGQWTGTMNLTEPQAGSDLAMIRSRAQPAGDGTYRISGTKIFITYGEHDLAENILHLVLARLPDAPEGVKGISLFLVPKFLVNEDGTLGARNDVHCVSIEHKLGIKASPTCTLQFGDAGGALGYLVGQENRGLDAMFIMMNAARYAVGVQGVAIADRAYQHARAYAAERVQSRPVDGSSKDAVPIIQHPDVRRMLGTMRALTEAGRALAYYTAGHADLAHASPDAEARKRHLAVQEYLVPIVKGWCTEMSIDVASLGVQVHGGMGFIEETGAAQYYRDARILTIYEGTTAIQANDLVGRKTLRDGGAVARALLAEIGKTEAALEARSEPAARLILTPLRQARAALADAIDFILANAAARPNAVFAAAVPYLMLAGTTLAGWQMARALLASLDLRQEDPAFHDAKIATVQCYALHKLSQAPGLAAVVTGSGEYEVQA
ncbi:acyl-CoA dehydrogenase [Achromobacter insolitus]|uniref:acyl-CoA dehydrogenase n=3 Tax=Achromobacter insolitus TaxID=217204 RepID=UPI000538B53B|nr:acyl-CoA dehydrogenase [Achromobacter insolitus]GLK94321.1 acyl-CoA dehydrogenase [Achromobacter xylosoxidans]APX73829.1 acyl-CoA dehydrogenase [Achromobacter insolitus]AVG38664.1 acyl-CoA dehydrogenase [Achromobacter insolitus]OWT54686.1 acyl-CoA dehydrogenase [Achromobacter insolitus]CAB3733479.1 3-methylmercaptopropionyl-CoA dehydrogenase [Achromobacter insolitus]